MNLDLLTDEEFEELCRLLEIDYRYSSERTMTMNEVTVFVYLTFFIGIFGMTFAFMWKMMGSTLAELTNQRKNRIIDIQKWMM